MEDQEALPSFKSGGVLRATFQPPDTASIFESPFILSMSASVARDEAWIKEQLKRFTYKPGWQFEVRNGWLTISTEVEDTYNPGRMIRVASRHNVFMLWCANDEDAFAWHLAKLIKDLEIHESREWLRRDGAIFDDPHANERQT